MTEAPSPSPKFVSPSRLARYYFHECERFLRYSSTPKETREAEGVPSMPYDHSPVTNAILEGGALWEEELLTKLGDTVIMGPPPEDGPGRPSDRVIPSEMFAELLRTTAPGRMLYEPQLIAAPTFYEAYGVDPAVVRMSESRPDLLQILEDPNDPSRRRTVRVLEVKASVQLKLSHRIQAALYTILLDHLIAHLGIADLRTDDQAGIWLYGEPEPQPFEIRHVRPPIETFLSTELMPLMAAPAADAFWHVYYRCEWCPYFEHCWEEMNRTDDLSRVPNLTSHAKRYLTGPDVGLRSVKDFGKLLRRPDAEDVRP